MTQTSKGFSTIWTMNGFRNGKRGVATAAVDDFDIDPDDRIAEITFELDDGSTVYGSYDKDSNSYSYSS